MNKKLYSLMVAAAAAVAVCSSKAEAYVSVGVDWVSQCAPAVPYAPSVSAGISYDGGSVNGYVNGSVGGYVGSAYACPPPLPPRHCCHPQPPCHGHRRHGHHGGHHYPQPCRPHRGHHGGYCR